MENPFARSSWYPARSSTSLSDMTRAAKALTGLLLLAALAGCGFKPLYGDRGVTSMADTLANIAVVVDGGDGQVGRLVQYELLDNLSSSGVAPKNADYRVDLTTSFYERDLAIQRDAEVTRTSVVAMVTFRLVDTRTGQQVMRSVARSRSSYNRVASEFANITASQDAQRRLAKTIADDIRIQIAVELDRIAGKDPS